jgi:hypothetical protein
LSSLRTVIEPNALGALEGEYKGPADITQYYFFAGILTVPLALIGIWKHKARWTVFALIVPALWYALGPDFGLYRILARMPGLGSVRAPVHIWFVIALGLATAAGAGLVAVREMWKVPAIGWLAPLLLFADLCYFNSLTNPLAYQRTSFEEIYGARLAQFQQRIAAKLPAASRFHAPYASPGFGPLNHPLDARAETTYGYNPLTLARYNAYLGALNGNPALINALGARFVLDAQRQGVALNDAAMPRATFPSRVIRADGYAAQIKALAALDPTQAMIAAQAVPSQDGQAIAAITQQSAGRYTIRYRAGAASLLRFAEAYYPGWTAELNGKALKIEPVDVALIGIHVPPGEGEIKLAYTTPHFSLYLAITLVSLAGCAGFLVRKRKSLAVLD